jgi:hypothetical protein
MCRKLLSALLILGWISLSCFDVVEDLDEIPAQSAFSSSSPDSANAKLWGWGPLLNIVDFANSTKRPEFALVSFTPILLDTDPTFDFPVHTHLHKLYRVFLI